MTQYEVKKKKRYNEKTLNYYNKLFSKKLTKRIQKD